MSCTSYGGKPLRGALDTTGQQCIIFYGKVILYNRTLGIRTSSTRQGHHTDYVLSCCTILCREVISSTQVPLYFPSCSHSYSVPINMMNVSTQYQYSTSKQTSLGGSVQGPETRVGRLSSTSVLPTQASFFTKDRKCDTIG